MASVIWSGLSAVTIASLFVLPWDDASSAVNHLRVGALAITSIAALMRLGMAQDRPRGIILTEIDELPINDGRWSCCPGPDLNRPAASLGDLVNDEFFDGD